MDAKITLSFDKEIILKGSNMHKKQYKLVAFDGIDIR